MLGLPEQVGGDELGVGVSVGDHRDLGRPGEQVDADLPEQLALGLGHVRVAGADDHVGRLEALDPERHRRERLDSAEAEDVVGAGGRHRVQHRRVDPPAVLRRRAGDDRLDAGDLRHDHGHERRGEHRVAPAGDVGADRRHRDVPVAEGDAGPSSTSRSVSVARCACANARTWLWANAMCSRSSGSRLASTRAISSGPTRNDGGSQPSSSREY